MLTRILFINHTAVPGGAELALLRLIQNLDRTRFEPKVLLFAEGVLAERLRARGVETYCLPLSARVNSASRQLLGWRSVFRLKEVALVLRQILRVIFFLRAHRVDLVHTNSLKSDLIGGLAAWLTNHRLIWHIHDRIAPDYLPAPAVMAFRFLARTMPDFVVTNSRSTLQTFLPRPPRASAVVYPGVELAVAPPAAAETPRATWQIGLVGRISPTKGQEVFLAAAALVAQEIPSACFAIIGAAFFNDAPWETHIHQLAASYPHLQVEFTGFCSNVAERIDRLDVLVHASTTPEPFGQVVAEAMAHSKPVVAVGTGGVPEIVVEGETGWLVQPHDAAKMADRILWLLQHPAEAAEMGRRGRARAEELFSIKRSAEQIEGIYARVLKLKTKP